MLVLLVLVSSTSTGGIIVLPVLLSPGPVAVS